LEGARYAARRGRPRYAGPSGCPAVLALRGVSQNSLRSDSCEPWSAKRCAPRRHRGAAHTAPRTGRLSWCWCRLPPPRPCPRGRGRKAGGAALLRPRRRGLSLWAADVTGPSGFPALLATGGVSQNSLRSNSCEPW